MSQHFEPDRDDEMRARLIAKAWRDPTFKQELLANPKEVVARELGVDTLPDELDVQIFEEPPNGIYFILPPPPEEFGGFGPGEHDVEALTEVALKPERRRPTRGWYCY